jgi:hypothetical protein
MATIDNPDTIGSFGPDINLTGGGGGDLSPSVRLLELPSKILPCYTTIIEEAGKFTLVSGYTKVQFKISEDQTRISTFVINGNGIGEGGATTLCQLANFAPDMQCMKESMEHYAVREEDVSKLYSILFNPCAVETLNINNVDLLAALRYDGNLYSNEQDEADLTLNFGEEGAQQHITLSNVEGTGVEGSKSGKVSATVDEEHKRRRQKDDQSR